MQTFYRTLIFTNFQNWTRIRTLVGCNEVNTETGFSREYKYRKLKLSLRQTLSTSTDGYSFFTVMELEQKMIRNFSPFKLKQIAVLV